MRSFVSLARWLVGILFIVSGLVKANDPLGLSYKMQEFFEVWNSDLAASSFFGASFLIPFFNWLHGFSLPLAILMITLEIVAGVALLAGWQKKLVLPLLLVLILFFTFLTAYATWSGKFKNCGCFGDCLPISPMASFVKDIVLLFLILLLWFGRRHLSPLFCNRRAAIIVGASLIISLALQAYVLHYLPIADCLPYKEGNNITQQMQVPAGAKPDSFAIRFVYKKGTQTFEFPAEGLPADLDQYTYVDRIDKLVRKGNAEPPIKGFALTGISGVDSTTAILALPKAVLLLAENLQLPKASWLPRFKNMVEAAGKKGIPVFVATAGSLAAAKEALVQQGFSEIPVFSLDFTAIRTAARTNPTALYLEQGTIGGKYSYHQLHQVLPD